MKPCIKCGATDRYATPGMIGRCRPCVRARAAKFYDENKPSCQANSARRYRANKAKARSYARRYRGLPNPTRPEPDVCELCGKPPGKRALALDHCHESGAFRGWLCGNCNVGIGQLKDSPALLRAAADYLEKHTK